jgi:hypothetical protein
MWVVAIGLHYLFGCAYRHLVLFGKAVDYRHSDIELLNRFGNISLEFLNILFCLTLAGSSLRDKFGAIVIGC